MSLTEQQQALVIELLRYTSQKSREISDAQAEEAQAKARRAKLQEEQAKIDLECARVTMEYIRSKFAEDRGDKIPIRYPS